MNEGDCVYFLSGSLFVYYEHVCEPSLCGAFREFLDWEVCSASRAKGRAREDIKEVGGEDMGRTG